MKKIISGSFIALLLTIATPAAAEVGGTITRQAPAPTITTDKIVTAVLELFSWNSAMGSITFDNGRYSASAGCNNIFGTYSLRGTSIALGAPASTLMFCEDKMEDEAVLISTLNTATNLTFKGSGFMLSNVSTSTFFAATIAPIPDNSGK